jgi:hypothetical protein
MEIKPIHTFAELQEAAGEQHLRIDERNGKYRVVRKISERFVVVEAGAGYSLDQDGLREFLLFNTIGIGERLTDWSGGHGHKLNRLHFKDPIPGKQEPPGNTGS